MSRPMIAVIGAGSTVFARSLLRDIYSFPELREASLRLMDIDPERLRDSEMVARRVAGDYKATGLILATQELREALYDADFVITMFQVGGFQPATVTDFEVPKTYGLRQTIGDTLGIGGIMRGLRTIPVLLDIAHEMEIFCPDALLLNYVNPIAMLMWAVHRSVSIKSVGLCHSVQGTARELAGFLDIPAHDIDYLCAGINHMAFYLRLERNGEDLYPALWELEARGDFPAYERVRFSVLRNFGYFVTESSEHFSEYVPWFIKQGRQDLLDRFNVPLDEYPARCRDQIADWQEMRKALLSDDSAMMDEYQRHQGSTVDGNWERRLAKQKMVDPQLAAHIRKQVLEGRRDRAGGHSGEYGSLVIHSMVTGTPRTVYGNVRNSELISNLPPECCVEVPCMVNQNGLHPQPVGELPPQLASLMQTNINVQRMTVEASLTRNRDHIYQAALLDPHTAAELDPDQIRSLVDDLIAAHGALLPSFPSEQQVTA